MGIEDLEPELVELLSGTAERLAVLEDHFVVLKRENDNLKEKIMTQVREEQGKLKAEVKSAFNE